MFGNIAALSFAQHTRLDEMISEAQADSQTVSGLLVDNPMLGFGGLARVVLVLNDEPATGSEYDRVFDFDGTEVGRAEASATLAFEGLGLSSPTEAVTETA